MLPQLRSLNIRSTFFANEVGFVSPLSKLSKLENLNMCFYSSVDAGVPGRIPEETTHVSMKEANKLEALRGLKTLSMNHVMVEPNDVRFLRNLTQLVHLQITNCNHPKLPQLHHFTDLQELYVDNDSCVELCKSTKGNDSSMAYLKVRQVAEQQCIAQHKSATGKVDCEHRAMIACTQACSKARPAPVVE